MSFNVYVYILLGLDALGFFIPKDSVAHLCFSTAVVTVYLLGLVSLALEWYGKEKVL